MVRKQTDVEDDLEIAGLHMPGRLAQTLVSGLAMNDLRHIARPFNLKVKSVAHHGDVVSMNSCHKNDPKTIIKFSAVVRWSSTQHGS